MVLQNYVILQEGIPSRVHFSDHRIIKRTITDPVTGEGTTRNVLEFTVDRLGGSPVDARYSIMSEKHAQDFVPFLDNNLYRDYEFIITQRGEGFRRAWTVQHLPLK